MPQIPPQEYPSVYQDKLEQMEERRRQIQEDHELDYQKALIQIKEELREKEGDEMVETMKDEIRDWFQNEK